jgi:hypothetical protein
MRKSLLYGFLGLVSVSTIAGCGLLGNSGDGCSNGRCSSNPAKKDCAICQVTIPSKAYAQTSHVRIEGAQSAKQTELEMKEESPIILETTPKVLPKLTVPAKHQQDAAPAPKRAEIPVVEKSNALADEMAIVNREAAALRDRVAKRGADKTPSVIAQSAIEPILPTPSITTKPAVESIPTPAEITIPVPQENAAKEKIVTIKGIEIHYGEKDNYKSITGQVQQYRKTWRLRYASIDQEDIHGGVVVLEGGADLNKLQDGQHVRVTGVLVPPATRTSSATYRVQTVEILD